MKLISIILLLPILMYGQISEPFDSFDGPGEWTSPGGNTGSHSGELCYNTTGTYQVDTWLIFESPVYDFSGYGQVDLLWFQEINLRNGDELRLYLFDSGWSYFDLTDLNGLLQVTIPNTVTRLTFDLLTYGNGNPNNKYAHIAFLDILNPTPLPIELLEFTATVDRSIVDINWSTASQANNDYFTIERSQNGYNWEDLEEIDGAGNSTSTLNYNIKDLRPYLGTSYYRLTQTDYDGASETFQPVSVFIDKPYIVRRYNQLGQDVDEDCKGLVIILMSDGSIKKILNFN